MESRLRLQALGRRYVCFGYERICMAIKVCCRIPLRWGACLGLAEFACLVSRDFSFHEQ